MSQPNVRFAVTGLNHGHIYGQTSSVLEAGAERLGTLQYPAHANLRLKEH